MWLIFVLSIFLPWDIIISNYLHGKTYITCAWLMHQKKEKPFHWTFKNDIYTYTIWVLIYRLVHKIKIYLNLFLKCSFSRWFCQLCVNDSDILFWKDVDLLNCQVSCVSISLLSLPWYFSILMLFFIQDAIECLNNLQTNAATLDRIKKERQQGIDKLKSSYSIPDMKKFLNRLQIDVSKDVNLLPT